MSPLVLQRPPDFPAFFVWTGLSGRKLVWLVFKRPFCMMIIGVAYFVWSVFILTLAWTCTTFTFSVMKRIVFVFFFECAPGCKLFVITAFVFLYVAPVLGIVLSSELQLFFSFISVLLLFYPWPFVTLCFSCVAVVLLKLFFPCAPLQSLVFLVLPCLPPTTPLLSLLLTNPWVSLLFQCVPYSNCVLFCN